MAEEKRCQLLAPLLPDHASIETFHRDVLTLLSKHGYPVRGYLSMTPPASSKPGFK